MRRPLAPALGYLGSGGAAALVDVGGFAGLHALGCGVAAAGAASFLVAAVVNYLLSTLVVFRTAPSAGRFAAFLAGACAGLAINAGVTLLAARHLPVPAVLAKVVGIGVAFGFNLLLNTRLVFRAAEPAPEPAPSRAPARLPALGPFV